MPNVNSIDQLPCSIRRRGQNMVEKNREKVAAYSLKIMVVTFSSLKLSSETQNQMHCFSSFVCNSSCEGDGNMTQ